jgi:hypothetical protein
MTNAKSPPATIQQQADYLRYLAGRCICVNGKPAEVTLLAIEARDYDALSALAERLERMAPHEAAIRRIVVGK